MPLTADRVQETAAAPGTGALTLAGATAGCRTFAAAFPVGSEVYACIESQTPGSWEVCEAVLASSTSLTRVRTISSSTGSEVNFTGPVNVFSTWPARALRGAGPGQRLASTLGDRGMI